MVTRRDFLKTSVAAGVLSGLGIAQTTKRSATDWVTLGKSNVKVTRLALGTGTHGGREQRGPGTDVRTEQMRILEPEYVGDPNHEPSHRPRRQQRVATLGLAETGQVDRHQMRVLGESLPSRLEGEQALGPRTQ